MPGRRMLRTVATVAGALVIMVVLSPMASAHVRLSSPDASPGANATLSFRVPSESRTASTTEVIVTFPADTPIGNAQAQHLPGWTATWHNAYVSGRIKEEEGPANYAVSRIVWKADSAASAIKPGEFAVFTIVAGPLPDVATLTFPTEQHYSDGTTVRWDELATGSAEPDHPAPTLHLAAASAAPAPAASTLAAVPGPANSPLSIIGVVLATTAGIIALIALLRTRQTKT